MNTKYSLFLPILVAFGSAQASGQASSLLSASKSAAMPSAFSTTGTRASFARLSQAADNIVGFSSLSLPAAATVLPFNAESFISLGDEIRLNNVSDSHLHTHASLSGHEMSNSSTNATSANVERSRATLDSAQSLPKPETWAMVLAGLGLIGLQLRHNNAGNIAIG